MVEADRSLVKGGGGWQAVLSHRHSYDEYRLAKVLPHIKEEFYYRVENRIMVEKIINPRRDKTILDSLAHTMCKSSNKKKPNRKQTFFLHRRKLDLSGIIKRQIRPQTCQINTQIAHSGSSFPFPADERQCLKRKESASSQQEDLQAATEPVQCRWLLTDSSSQREGSIGRIVKNRQAEEVRPAHATRRDVKAKNATLPCEAEVGCDGKEKKTSVLEQYLGAGCPSVKRLERRVFPQHFHNKENVLLN
jgi:hypothetical protein